MSGSDAPPGTNITPFPRRPVREPPPRKSPPPAAQDALLLQVWPTVEEGDDRWTVVLISPAETRLLAHFPTLDAARNKARFWFDLRGVPFDDAATAQWRSP